MNATDKTPVDLLALAQSQAERIEALDSRVNGFISRHGSRGGAVARLVCLLTDHPGYIREHGRWRCVRCRRVMEVGE